MALSTVLAWLLSTNDQRLGYLSALGFQDLIERLAGRELVVIGPGLEYQLIRFPPRPEPAAPPKPTAAAVPENTLAQRPKPSPSIPVTRHDYQDFGKPCLAKPVLNPTRKQQHNIYRWTDSSGKAVFSDRNLASDAAEIVGQTAQGGVGMFSAEYRFLGEQPDAAFKLALSANVNGVFQFLSNSLSLKDVEPLHVRLTIVSGERRFVAYRDGQTRNLATVSGFYSYLTNEAVVRWMGPQQSMAVSRHEITHLALGNWLGDVPLWLNEGLAEFVERLSFQQAYALSPAPLAKLAEVRRLRDAGRLPALRAFLEMERDDWNGIGDEVAYPYAWSLTHYLIQRPGGRELVADYLRTLADNRCRRLDRIGHLDRIYPGGLARLDADWSHWIDQGLALPLTF